MAIFRGVGGAVGSTTSAVISEATEAAQTATEKAAEAAASASNAATSKINAATSASNALSSATSAAASAALYEDFLDRYLGAKNTTPTTDNDGNPLQVGVLYYSENDEELLVWSGSAWVSPLVSPAIRDSFAGDGSTVAFTLSRDPSTEANTQVYINGIYQNKSTYSVSGTTLTFSTAPADGDSIEVMSQKSTSVLMADTDNATYTASGAGAVTRTLNEKLGDTVSVKDFGAVGDGVVDDTQAIQAALDSVSVNYTSTNWWEKYKDIDIGTGNRVAIGSYQNNYADIIRFNQLSWPINATVSFSGGTGETVQHSNHLALDGTPVNEWRLEAPYHPAIVLNQRTPASYTEVQPAHSLGSNDSREFASIVFSQDSVGQFQMFSDLQNATFQVKTFPPVSGGFLSKVWQIDAETGDMGVQVSSIDAVDNASLSVGGSLKIRNGTGAINGHESETEPRIYFHDGNSGQRSYLALDSLTKALNVKSLSNTAEGAVSFKIDENVFFYKCTYSGLPSTAAGLKIGKNSSTDVSIIASGAIKILNVGWFSGVGTPEGSVSAPVGSFYSRTDGGANTSFYVKESGTGNTGWIAK